MEGVGLSAWRCGFLLIRQLTVNVLRKMTNVPAAFRDENSSDSSSKGHRICRGFNEIEFHQSICAAFYFYFCEDQFAFPSDLNSQDIKRS